MRFLILLAIIGAALAVPKHQQRIAGGEPTTAEHFPFMASMQYGWLAILWLQYCGGSLISNNAVLSAAHCYEDDFAITWRVLLGTNDGYSDGSWHQVQSLILHPEFNSRSLIHDIAIIRLESPAILSHTIGLARIAGPNYILPDRTPLTAIGFGELSHGGSSAEQLQFAELNLINHAYCASEYAYLKTVPGYQNLPDVTDEMICAGVVGGGKGACEGDSGGPLLHDTDIVFGITSWDFRCADSRYPGVSTRVGPYSNWILFNVQ